MKEELAYLLIVGIYKVNQLVAQPKALFPIISFPKDILN